MRSIVLNLIIVSALGAATKDDSAPSSHALDLYRCDFDASADVNDDGWPDGWTRLRGPGYPQYVRIGIVPEGPAGKPVVRMKLDGAAARVRSAPLSVGPRFSYVVEATLRTQGLKHDVASVSLLFLDEQRKVLEEVESERLSGTTAWTDVRIGPVAPSSEKTRYAQLQFHLRGGQRDDLRGSASLSSIKLSRLPRMTLSAGGLKHLYFAGEQPVLVTDVTGMSAHDNEVQFELFDAFGQRLAEHKQALIAEPLPAVQGDTRASLAASARWKPPIGEVGFYRVQVSMVGEDGVQLRRSTTLALIEPHLAGANRRFGWSLPEGERPHDYAALTTLLPQAGIGRLKFPAWCSDDDSGRADKLAWFAERLGQHGIEMVGMLDQPPPSQAKAFGSRERVPIALLLNDASLWQPSLDPVMMRLTLKVHAWQLGSDEDTSFVGYRDLAGKVKELREAFNRYGQEVGVALVWQAGQKEPHDSEADWQFVSVAPETQSPEQLVAQYTQPPPGGAARWICLQPIASDSADTQQRVSDLVRRMVAAACCPVDCAFIANPFDDERGLFHADGTPAELFLPWRTTAQALAQRERLNPMRLPHGSSNQVFVGKDDAVMVLWNARPTQEHFYLGERVELLNVWGRRRPLVPETIDGIRQHVVDVGTEPIFVTGIDKSILRWRLGFEFEKPRLESVFGREQMVTCRFRNTFDRLVAGELALAAPGIWDTPPPPQKFQLSPGEERAVAVPLLLRPDADTGVQNVRVDFTLMGNQEVRFNLYRPLTIGLDDLSTELETQLEPGGDLLVKAHVSNQTAKAVNFRATLFVPEHRRQQQTIAALPGETALAVFRLDHGATFVDQELRLRLEEVGGSRVINSRVKATR